MMHRVFWRVPLAWLGLAALLTGCAGVGRMPAGEQMLLAEIAVDRGQYPLAVQTYRLAAATSRDEHVAARAARLAFESGETRALERIAREWLGRDPHSEVARRYRAVALLELDRRADAEQELLLLLTSAYPSPAEGFGGLAESLAQLRNDTGVARVVARLAARYPDLPEAALASAQLALAAGDSATALAATGRVLAREPGRRDARWIAARALVAAGRCDEGLKESGTLAAESTDADRLVHAWLLGACDRGAEARAYFGDLANSRTVRAEALEGLAGYDVDARRFDDAANRYGEVLSTGRNGERAMYGLAVTADRRGDVERAIKFYSRVTAGGRVVPAQLRAYRLELERGGAQAAARQLDEFVAASPEQRVAATAGRAQLLADFGRQREALALLARATVAYPDREELRYARAAVLERSGQVDAALTELRAVVDARPEDPNAENALGFTLADHGRNLAEAERRIRAALAERPDSAAIMDSLGWVLHRRGQTADALGWLRRAYALDPDPEIAAHLGLAQWALGDRAGAEHSWRESLERNPGERHLQQAIESHLGPRS